MADGGRCEAGIHPIGTSQGLEQVDFSGGMAAVAEAAVAASMVEQGVMAGAAGGAAVGNTGMMEGSDDGTMVGKDDSGRYGGTADGDSI